MQQAVHEREAPGVGHQLHAHIGIHNLKGALGFGQFQQIVRLGADGAVCGNQETGRACGRVLHGLAHLRAHDGDHGVNQRAWCEVLACAAFGLGGVLFQQAFVQVAQAILVSVKPVNLVQAADELLQMARFLQARLRIGIDGGNAHIGGLRELEQRFLVVVQQVQAGLAAQLLPACVFGQQRCGDDAGLHILMLHLDKEQQHQLGDVVAVVDAVVTQHVAKVPEFLDDVRGGHRGCVVVLIAASAGFIWVSACFMPEMLINPALAALFSEI